MISFAVLWQHVLQVVVCILSAVQRALRTARHSVHTPETHAATILQNLS